MFLSDQDIAKAVNKGDIVLEPFIDEHLQPASYDIRLGNKFVVNDTNETHSIDPSRKIFAKTREIIIPDEKEFILHPGVSVLGISLEYFGSNTYLVQLSGKSSLARIGLVVHNTAGLINPGHYLHVTFELCNLNNVPIILRPGMPIAQLLFAHLSSPPRKDYEKIGRFAKDNWKNFSAPKKEKQEKALHLRSKKIKK